MTYYICIVFKQKRIESGIAMKFLYSAISCLLLFSFSLSAQKDKAIPTIYIDGEGVIRWSDTNNDASFYGVNYTLPFAHAYRAIEYLGKDHKKAIDMDVYHFARLGYNAYRIHVWDVEISDGDGNLIENEHLDLLDYLIAKLREHNIRVLITTMTNFGNGYPERNHNTGAFSYLYDKCKVHSDENAIAAQEKYIQQFINHRNTYTHLLYKEDPYIIGFEVNNEPCHAETPQQTENYINRMLGALKKAGNRKPVFYNVSHNMWHVQAYYNTAVQGTTYQWYPIGLVAGHTRKGNFLPYVDNYDISFSDVKNFGKKAKAVYEYDPADITYSYMHPAMARTFRSSGFQWITQFAYDPIDIAWANTEYQTHFLNLAYTPGKAISTKIAAEVAYSVPMFRQYPAYPNDTVFDSFRVSYRDDLSEMNTADKFFYSNSTYTVPLNKETLEEIAGVGSSPVITYEGTGAYFLNRLEEGLWRLEVMPDAVQIRDPFEKASLKKEVVSIVWNEWQMKINLPGLGENFVIAAINNGNSFEEISDGTGFSIKPGVYLLKRNGYTPAGEWAPDTRWKTIRLGEYVAPEGNLKGFSVVHEPAKVSETGFPLGIQATIVRASFPDSVLIYTDKVSIWSDANKYIKMERGHNYVYKAVLVDDKLKEGNLRYNIVVFENGKSYTYPAGNEGNPLDWDYYRTEFYETEIVKPQSPVELVRVSGQNKEGVESYAIPQSSYISGGYNGDGFATTQFLKYKLNVNDKDARFFWQKYIKGHIVDRASGLKNAGYLCVNIGNTEGIGRIKAGFVTSDGYTYTTVLSLSPGIILYRLPLSELRQDKTVLLPSPYPVFLKSFFEPETRIPFSIENIETIILSTMDDITGEASVELGNIWLE